MLKKLKLLRLNRQNIKVTNHHVHTRYQHFSIFLWFSINLNMFSLKSNIKKMKLQLKTKIHFLKYIFRFESCQTWIKLWKKIFKWLRCTVENRCIIYLKRSWNTEISSLKDTSFTNIIFECKLIELQHSG